MTSLIRRLLAAAALLLALGGASQLLPSANAVDEVGSPAEKRVGKAAKQAQKEASALAAAPSGSVAENLILGSEDGSEPETMEQFLTAVTQDVDAYWTKVFKESGLPEPRVSYTGSRRPDGGERVRRRERQLGDDAAAYCPGDDTIYISEQFATEIYGGALDQALPGSSQGYGGTAATSRWRTSSRTSTATRSRTSSGSSSATASSSRRWRSSCRPTATPAPGPTAPTRRTGSRTVTCRRRSTRHSRSATSTRATPAITARPSSARQAWNSGFESGDPSACNQYLSPDPANGGATTRGVGC